MSDDDSNVASEVVDETIELIEHLLDNREEVIAGLNEEIDRVQSRYTVLVAIRDSLLAEEEESGEANGAALPIDTPTDKPQLAGDTDIESLIVQHVAKHGAAMPGDIAAAIGVHATKIGRVVSKSTQLVKDGKLIRAS